MKQAMDLAGNAHFIGAWFRNPLQTGALWPSGQALARAMARCVDPCQPGPVVELGAGTGAITRELLARGLAPQRLVAIEKDPALCRVLRLRFPEVSVLRGDVAELVALLAAAGAGRAGTLVSGLPLLGMPRQGRRRVLEQIAACLGPGGVLVQFTYSPLPPVSRAACAAFGWSGRRVAWVPWNLPPAAVWIYTGSAEM
ncbi:MAG TPA: methyltransferase domain-containing protein [Acidiferrobacterales bacterium]|nr:methyltransferase domain-containing protein [Acidiferrobacterales bacterium]